MGRASGDTAHVTTRAQTKTTPVRKPRLPARDAANGFDALQPQDITLGLMGEYVEPRKDEVWSGGLVQLLEDLGFSTAASRIALGRLVRRELLQRTKKGRLVYYTISPRLDALLEEGHRRIYSFQSEEEWDGIWTLVWYSIPDERRLERRRLSRRLRFLGFGAIQDGTWIAPRNREQEITPILKDLRLDGHTVMFVGHPAQSLDDRALVERAWDLADLGDRYASFAAEFGRYRKPAVLGRLSDGEAFVLRTHALDAFRRFASLDPKLPDHLLGRRWRRREAVEIFRDVEEALREPATRHFDAVATPPPPKQRK